MSRRWWFPRLRLWLRKRREARQFRQWERDLIDANHLHFGPGR